jgi:hypothetical protein
VISWPIQDLSFVHFMSFCQFCWSVPGEVKGKTPLIDISLDGLPGSSGPLLASKMEGERCGPVESGFVKDAPVYMVAFSFSGAIASPHDTEGITVCLITVKNRTHLKRTPYCYIFIYEPLQNSNVHLVPGILS